MANTNFRGDTGVIIDIFVVVGLCLLFLGLLYGVLIFSNYWKRSVCILNIEVSTKALIFGTKNYEGENIDCAKK